MSATFDSHPDEVVGRKGNEVMIQSPDGVKYRRNVSHVKRYKSHKRNYQSIPELTDNVSVDVKGPDLEESGILEPRKVALTMPVRPQRERRAPKRFKDYYMPKP